MTQLTEEIREEARHRLERGEVPTDLAETLDRSFRKFVPDTPPRQAGEGVREAIGRAQALAFITHHVPTGSLRRGIGPLLSLYKRVTAKLISWYMRAITDQTRDFATASLHAQRVAADRIENLERRSVETAERLEKTELARERAEALWGSAEGVSEKIDGMVGRMDALRLEERLARSERMMRFLNDKVDGLGAGSVSRVSAPGPSGAGTAGPASASGVAGVAGVSAAGPAGDAAAGEPAASRIERAFDYHMFQVAHRGGPEALEERIARYLPHFRGNQDVLDFGCGRGEILQAFKDAGIRAYGVELHPDAVAFCREQGLEVLEADGLEHLRSLGPESLGGIFLGQVVEHLDPRQLTELVEISFDALRPGGVFLAETVNPTCLGVFAHAFYIDLSHVKPVHPITMQFLLESAGFMDTRFEWLFPFDEQTRLKTLPERETWAGIFNEDVDKLNRLLYGPQDYAVVARKAR